MSKKCFLLIVENSWKSNRKKENLLSLLLANEKSSSVAISIWTEILFVETNVDTWEMILLAESKKDSCCFLRTRSFSLSFLMRCSTSILATSCCIASSWLEKEVDWKSRISCVDEIKLIRVFDDDEMKTKTIVCRFWARRDVFLTLINWQRKDIIVYCL